MSRSTKVQKKIESAAPRDFSLHVNTTGSGPFASAEAGIKEENGSHIASASASAYALKGEAEQDQFWGLSKYKASGEVLSANAEAKAYASLSHNGVAVPSFGASGEAKASVASGEVEHTVGLEKYNIHGGAEGYVVGAEANAEAKFGVMEDGSYSASLEAGAGAYLAKGEVSAGFTVFGIDIDAKIGGNIGVGGKAGISLETDSFDISAGLSALLGVEAEVSIDWSDIGW